MKRKSGISGSGPMTEADAQAFLAADRLLMGADQRHFFGTAKVGNKYANTGPQPTREAARDAARLLLKGRAAMRGEVSTGRGAFGPHFDIRWHPKTEK